jgi:hypothetical protein
LTLPIAYTAFHLNLAFSSIEEAQRVDVVERCYWPLLRLAEGGFRIGIEATSYTLEAINSIDLAWVEKLSQLIKENQIEFIASGYVQMIAPLVPADMTRRNLEYGLQDYERLLGMRPTIAMVNEQAFSPGLVPLYQQAGFDAIIMDCSEPSSHNRNWSKSYTHRPFRILGADDTVIPVIWSDAISFQKLQRYAHGEIEADEYLEFLNVQLQRGVECFPLYTSDAEVFDFRPGRFTAEAARRSVSEFERISLLLGALVGSGAIKLGTPSDALLELNDSDPPIRLETAKAPVPVKKQRKYNVLRWAVSGRNDLALNTYCWRLFENYQHSNPSEQTWRTLCRLWASDYRTHITDKRWQSMLLELPEVTERPELSEPKFAPEQFQGGEAVLPEANAAMPNDICIDRQGRFLVIETATSHLCLNCGRGLAIQAFGFGPYHSGLAGAPHKSSLIGTLSHGYYDDIAFGADFYSGHYVFEPTGEHKKTDLQPCEPNVWWDTEREQLNVQVTFDVGGKPIKKTIGLLPNDSKLTISYEGEILSEAEGTLRCAHVTLNPRAFDPRTLYYSGQNGGHQRETHRLWQEGTILPINHGASVSRLVSGTTGLGLTDGVLEFGDDTHFVRICMDRRDAAGAGMVTSQTIGSSYFVRGAISLAETDETARPQARSDFYDQIHPLIRFSIELGKQS